MRESYVERELVRGVKALGGKAYKFISPGCNGVPDRLVLFGGRSYFVELKRPGEKLRPQQEYRAKELRTLGANVVSIDNVDGVDKFLLRLLEERT